jgi:D-hexose-6-phosphate mutarotase
MTSHQKILRETLKCQKYAFINKHIHNADILRPGNIIQAFIKNYQKVGVYCSLNIGVSGIVLDPLSVSQLQKYFDIGDVIQVEVEGFRKSGHIILRFIGPHNPSNFIPQ